MNIDRNYETAKEIYAAYGVKTPNEVLEKMKEIPRPLLADR